MTFSIKILESDPIIKGRIIRAIAQELNNVFARSKGNITREIRKLTETLISMSPEIQSLQGGELQGAFGIRQGEEQGVVDSIIEAIKVVSLMQDGDREKANLRLLQLQRKY